MWPGQQRSAEPKCLPAPSQPQNGLAEQHTNRPKKKAPQNMGAGTSSAIADFAIVFHSPLFYRLPAE